MLNPQVIVDLLPELRIGVDLTGRSRWVGKRFMADGELFLQLALSVGAFRSETNEFHKRLSVLGCLLQIPVERGAIFTGCFQQQPTPDVSSLQVNPEIALSGASAKVKPLDRSHAAESALGRRMT